MRLLIPTVPRYTDASSRSAVLSVLAALLARGDPSITNGLVKWLESEVTKVEKSGQTSTRFALLGWAATIYSSLAATAHEGDTAPSYASVVNSFSTLAYVLLDPTSEVKTSLRNSVLVISRRALRSVRASPLSCRRRIY